jgi:hypothetical protein
LIEKTIFVIIVIVHGLIHLLGFMKAYRLVDLPRLAQPVPRRVGLMWLSAACLFMLTALLYLFAPTVWWIVGLLTVVVSQTLIFLAWKDAKFGTIATVIVLVPLVIAIANALPGSFRDIYKEKATNGISRFRSQPPVTERDLAKLPAPVQKYLRYAGVVGKPRVQNFRATFTGRIRRSQESAWMDFTSQQYNFFDKPARMFFIESSLYGIPFDGLHLYEGSDATMQIKVASLFQIVDAKGDTMTKGETVTLFNDMCVMAPATLIDSSIQWQSIDTLTARGIFANAGFTISVLLTFNEEGQLVDFSSDDRFMSADGITYKNYRWTTPMGNYKNFGGRNVATQAELIWHMPEGEYTYGEFDLVDIEYNCREFRWSDKN